MLADQGQVPHTIDTDVHSTVHLPDSFALGLAYRPLEKAVEIAPQTLTAPERTGFTAVEWGGAECK